MVVYPRWRGELNIGNGFAAAASGLSPLARGARHSQADPATALRFIPAGAGNTVRRGGSTTVFSVYPRWRGEHINMQRERLPLAGLSPLARGTQSCVNSRRLHWRFIPAGAGNTGRNIDSMFRTTVYPRWRGEHILLGVIPSSVIGLSPLARGTRYMETHHDVQKRFIPAGAGNTPTFHEIRALAAVYPRWRGEHRDRLYTL